jgi:hypothetical protein
MSFLQLGIVFSNFDNWQNPFKKTCLKSCYCEWVCCTFIKICIFENVLEIFCFVDDEQITPVYVKSLFEISCDVIEDAKIKKENTQNWTVFSSPKKMEHDT